jgi:molybdate transport system ATP-binding protein
MVIEIAARDVMLSVEPPQGLSALNVLACDITSISSSRTGDAAMDVALVCGEDELMAQVTRRSVDVLGLAPGQHVCAVVKSVALGGSQSGLLDPTDT